MSDLSTVEVIELLSKEESSTLEFKVTIRDSKFLSQLISSFANANGGVILVGVQESGQIVGVSEAQVKKIFEAAVSLTIPSSLAALSFHKIASKTIAAIQVSGSGLAVLADGIPFVRAGTRIRQMVWHQITDRITEENAAEAQEELAKSVEKQSKIIEELHKEIAKANNWKSKWVDYVVSGLVGAVIGVILTSVMG